MSVQVASRIGESGHHEHEPIPEKTNKLRQTANDVPSIPPSEGPSRSLIHAESSASVFHRAHQPQVEGKLLPVDYLHVVSLSLIKQACSETPANECYQVPTPVNNSALSSELHAGNVYPYIYDTTHTPTYIDAAHVPATYRNYASLA